MSDDLVPPAEFRILLALVDGPKHGHGIRVEVRDRTAGRVDMGPGTLYGAIKRLVRRRWIEEIAPPAGEEGDGRRRFYRLTPAGRDAARAEVARIEELLDIAEAKSLRPAGGS
ncbi:MAG TPA: helix-turn-helix transcriptional regulator [Longimicrobiales bacterium]|nr:helix-turn-helix transcriptional regulator [Longimicrobiales bacterium]